MARQAAWVNEREEPGERVVDSGAFQIVDADRDTRNPRGLKQESGCPGGREVMEEEAADDNVDAFVRQRDGQRVAGEAGRG